MTAPATRRVSSWVRGWDAEGAVTTALLPQGVRGGRDGAGSNPAPPVPAELETLSEGSPQPRFHAVCELFGTRVIWKNGVILGFAA